MSKVFDLFEKEFIEYAHREAADFSVFDAMTEEERNSSQELLLKKVDEQSVTMIEALGFLRYAAAIPRLLEILKCSKGSTKVVTARALFRISGETRYLDELGRELLNTSMFSKNTLARTTAAIALGDGGQYAVQYLKQVVADSDSSVRHHARRSLCTILGMEIAWTEFEKSNQLVFKDRKKAEHVLTEKLLAELERLSTEHKTENGLK